MVVPFFPFRNCLGGQMFLPDIFLTLSHTCFIGVSADSFDTYSAHDWRFFWLKSCRAFACDLLKADMATVLGGRAFRMNRSRCTGAPASHQARQSFVLVIGDYFTKFADAVALPDQEAETVARAVVEEFICRYGAARQLHSDRGSNFESSLFQHVCKLLNIDKTRTTPRHPQNAGMVERFNRTLAIMLTMYCESKQNTWDENLPYVMLAYRSSVHDSTGFSPNMMMLGREVELPLQVVVGIPHEDQEQTPLEYVNDLQERLQGAHQEARKHLRRSAQHQKSTYEHKLAAQHQYYCGQAVWYYNSSVRKGLCWKLMSLWKGPYIVVGQLNDVTYLLQQGMRATSFSAHVDQMKPYRGDAPPRWYRGVVQTWVLFYSV